MSSKERRTFFTTHTNDELGKLINTEFEKAMVSSQKSAMTNWAKSVFDPKAKTKPVYKNILDKINNLDELGVLDPKSQDAFLQDLVSDKLGVSVSADEVRAISERAKAIQSAQEAMGDNFGDPFHEKEIISFLGAKHKMDLYLLSLSPAPISRVAVGTVGRGTMLLSVKSPLLNIESNTIFGVTEAFARRIASGRFRGANSKLAMDYVKMVNRVYKKTGYDLSRMVDLSSGGASGAKVLGDIVHAQGPGVVRKMGRFYEDVVFKKLLGAPDVAYSSAAFADSLNLNALKVAGGSKTKATELMRDAMRINPIDEDAKILRAQAIADAEFSTYTNKSAISNMSEGIRKSLNQLVPDLRLGDATMSFVKTPANVISAGIDYAGGGAVKAIYKTIKAFRSGEPLRPRAYYRLVARDLIRAG